MSPRGIVLTAYGHDLARLASSIAGEIELSAREIDRLVPPLVFVPSAGHGRTLEQTA